MFGYMNTLHAAGAPYDIILTTATHGMELYKLAPFATNTFPDSQAVWQAVWNIDISRKVSLEAQVFSSPPAEVTWSAVSSARLERKQSYLYIFMMADVG